MSNDDIQYSVTGSATLYLTPEELRRIPAGPTLVRNEGQTVLDLFSCGYKAVKGTKGRRRAFVIVGPEDLADSSDPALVELARPLIEERLAGPDAMTPASFGALAVPGGVGPVVILGYHPYDRELLRGDKGEWDGTGRFVISRADSRSSVSWDQIVQVTKPGASDPAWRVLIADAPRKGTTVRTR
jgi:hypothetical protein